MQTGHDPLRTADLHSAITTARRARRLLTEVKGSLDRVTALGMSGACFWPAALVAAPLQWRALRRAERQVAGVQPVLEQLDHELGELASRHGIRVAASRVGAVPWQTESSVHEWAAALGSLGSKQYARARSVTEGMLARVARILVALRGTLAERRAGAAGK